MDLEGWEIVPEDGFLEIQYDGGRKIFSRKYGADDPNNLFKNNYFISPSQDSSEFMESTEKSSSRLPNQLIHVPIQLSPSHDEELIKEIIHREPNKNSAISLKADHDQVSQVLFKKTIEDKSFEIDSPKSNNKAIPMKDEGLESMNSLPESELDKITEIKKDTSDEGAWGQDSGGLNIWKWSLNGFGAICSFGVVAASICIIILGGGNQNKQVQHNHKVQFHIFEDKRIKQVVHHATRLNEAITTVRGVSGVGAHITFGGYYEGL